MQISRKRLTSATVAAAALAGVLTLGGAGAKAQPASGQTSGMTLAGVWTVQVTQRDCATGAALGSFASLVTFAPGGTIVESPGGVAFAPGQRSGGHGTWTHDGGHRYSQRMVALILFDTPPNPPVSPGFLRGSQVITQTVELEDPDHFTSTGGADSYDASGRLYRSACSSAAGERFQ